jgi:bla regulator protein blaR1
MKPRMVTALLLASSVSLFGQQPAPPPGFDVASIKPSPPGTPDRLPRISPGRVEIFNSTLKELIRLAYSRFAFDTREITGGPSWIDSERFDIAATLGNPLPQGFDSTGLPAGLSAMLRTLIEDRFAVRTHNERRDGDVYALTFARSDKTIGAGLRSVPDTCAAAMKELTSASPPPRPTGPPPCSFGGSRGRLIGTGVTIAMFSSVLSGIVGRPVVVRTDLAGNFDIDLTFDPASVAKTLPGEPPGPAPIDDTKPSIFTALQEQLGLKLESTRGPIDVLIVDRAERPTAN